MHSSRNAMGGIARPSNCVASQIYFPGQIVPLAFCKAKERPCVAALRRAATSTKRVSASMRDRKRVVKGKSVSVRVDLGGGSIIKNKDTSNSAVCLRLDTSICINSPVL